MQSLSKRWGRGNICREQRHGHGLIRWMNGGAVVLWRVLPLFVCWRMWLGSDAEFQDPVLLTPLHHTTKPDDKTSHSPPGIDTNHLIDSSRLHHHYPFLSISGKFEPRDASPSNDHLLDPCDDGTIAVLWTIETTKKPPTGELFCANVPSWIPIYFTGGLVKNVLFYDYPSNVARPTGRRLVIPSTSSTIQGTMKTRNNDSLFSPPGLLPSSPSFPRNHSRYFLTPAWSCLMRSTLNHVNGESFGSPAIGIITIRFLSHVSGAVRINDDLLETRIFGTVWCSGSSWQYRGRVNDWSW